MCAAAHAQFYTDIPPASNDGFISPDLSIREREIMRMVVQQFIQTAAPVGSTALSRSSDIDLSSASIRNTMSSLEERGFLGHPHTSAGRVPTQEGYRLYVDELMDVAGLSADEASLLRAGVQRRLGDLDAVARETSRLLGRLSQLLAVVLSPRLASGILERLEIVPLSSTRVMFVIAVGGGLAKTVIAEVDEQVDTVGLDEIVQRLNERLVGLTLDEIRRTGAERVRDMAGSDRSGIVRVVLRDATKLFSETDGIQRTSLGGAHHLLTQPEFREPEEIQNIVELAESEDIVVHLLEQPALFDPEHPDKAVVLIGRELKETVDWRSPFSVVTARYNVAGATGTVGLIGPTRMQYARAVALVEHVAGLLSASSDS